MGLSVVVAAIGWWVALRIYGRGRGVEGGEAVAVRWPSVHRLLRSKYHVDEIYDATVVRGTWGLARGLFRFDAGFIDGFLVNGSRHVTVAISFLSGFFDKYVVDGLVNLTGWILHVFSFVFRRLQAGVVSLYAMVMAVGLLVLVGFYIIARVGL